MSDTKDNIGHPKKRAMIKALNDTLGVVTTACEAVGLARSTHYKWLKEDPDYKEAVEDTSEIALDFVESQLFDQIRNGGAAQTIFYLKTKGKKRGYVEQLDSNLDKIKEMLDKQNELIDQQYEQMKNK